MNYLVLAYTWAYVLFTLPAVVIGWQLAGFAGAVLGVIVLWAARRSLGLFITGYHNHAHRQ